MPTVHDVPAELLIARLSDQLRRVPQVSPPAWALYVKTGSHAERPPTEQGWWYARAASLLRKVYVHGPVGLSQLESWYGGRKARGYYLAHHRDAGGSVVRKSLQQLEAAGYVAKKQGIGRFLTEKGRSLLDRISNEILEELAKTQPALERYLK